MDRKLIDLLVFSGYKMLKRLINDPLSAVDNKLDLYLFWCRADFNLENRQDPQPGHVRVCGV